MTRRHQAFLSHQGFSLIEALIVLAIAGTISVGMVHFMTHQSLEVSHLENRLEIIGRENVLNNIMLTTSGCMNTFTTLSVVPNPSGFPIYDANTPKGPYMVPGTTYGKLKVSDVRLEMVPPVVPNTWNRGRLIAQMESAGVAHRQLKPIEIPLAIQTDPANLIVRCQLRDHSLPLPAPDLYNFEGYYLRKLTNVDEGVDVCCDPGDILISGHWSSYVGEANAWYRRTNGDRCMFFREGNAMGEDGDLEIFCGRSPP